MLQRLGPMRTGLLGDLHLGKSLYGFDLSSYIKRAMWDFFEFCKRESVGMAVQLGDVFDRSTPSEEHRKIVAQWCNEFDRARIPLWIIVGNHDVSSRENAPSALQYLKASTSRSLWVVDRPMCLVDGGGISRDLLFLPFPSPGIYSDRKEFEEDIEQETAGTSGKLLVFSHLNIQGAKLGKQEFVYRGADYSIPDYITRGDIFAGHIHKPQNVGCIEVLGAAERLRFDEVNQQRYFGLIECDDYNEEIRFKKYARHNALNLVQLDIDVSGVGNTEVPTTNAIVYRLPGSRDNSVIKIKPTVDKSSIVDWSEVRDWLYFRGAAHVIIDSPVNVDSTEKKKTYAKDPVIAAKQFIKMRVEDKSDRRKLLNTFKRKLEEVQ
jgi:exonuclease SbcD